MRFEDHVRLSLEAIKEENPDILEDYPDLVTKIVRETHIWMDHHYRQGMGTIEHRKYLHHEGGIEKTREKFSKEYGERWGELAEQEARRHIIQDFGRVPDKYYFFRFSFKPD